ncbi:hypothetical protein THAOC_36061 [Thalassiosira oceanica]|uniref:Uncharacterized protein n=1 Tax=Thalassiosira oceanica TaxID=159749 RepID=K0R2D6_THAOC|nr:hypothetical protein THAOC_36061 [Thalassiosira oceanica]|eukprot:EJK45329.1 hypothetical protein THAOC_36061 [Thalassiosira oceanica]
MWLATYGLWAASAPTSGVEQPAAQTSGELGGWSSSGSEGASEQAVRSRFLRECRVNLGHIQKNQQTLLLGALQNVQEAGLAS